MPQNPFLRIFSVIEFLMLGPRNAGCGRCGETEKTAAGGLGHRKGHDPDFLGQV
jgi:hypothetical protein